MQFLKLQHELITDTKITSNEFRIYTYLLSLYNDAVGCSYPSHETISDKLKISLSTVKRSIKRLIELEYMIIEKKKSIKGNYNTYKDFKYKSFEKELKEDPKEEIKDTTYNLQFQLINGQTNLELKEEEVNQVGTWELTKLQKAIDSFKKHNGNSFKYLVNCYNSNIKSIKEYKTKKDNRSKLDKFDNFTQRQYDYDKLEDMLLGYDNETELRDIMQ